MGCNRVQAKDSASVFAEYNRDLVRQVMRNNAMLPGKIKTAAKNKDFYGAAFALIDMAHGMYKIKDFTPRKGYPSRWTDAIERFIDTALMGIGACGEKDIDGLNKAIAGLVALNREGHRTFR